MVKVAIDRESNGLSPKVDKPMFEEIRRTFQQQIQGDDRTALRNTLSIIEVRADVADVYVVCTFLRKLRE